MTIEELKQALEAATPGPWEIFETGTWPETNHFYGIGATKPGNGCYAVAAIEGWTKGEHPNARLIVAAVNNLPKLLKVVEEREALQARCDKLEAAARAYIEDSSASPDEAFDLFERTFRSVVDGGDIHADLRKPEQVVRSRQVIVPTNNRSNEDE